METEFRRQRRSQSASLTLGTRKEAPWECSLRPETLFPHELEFRAAAVASPAHALPHAFGTAFRGGAGFPRESSGVRLGGTDTRDNVATVPTPEAITRTLAKLKVPSGLVGRTCWVVVALAAAVSTIAWAGRSERLCYASLVTLVVLVLPIMWRLFNYAEKHPQLTVLDGAEFLKYTQITAQKGLGEVRSARAISPGPLSLPAEDEATLALPEPSSLEQARNPPK
jgi:hypothetical protein